MRCAQLAFMTTTSDGVAAIRLWTQYHRAIGVELFYMFVNGQVTLTLSLGFNCTPTHSPFVCNLRMA